MDRIEIHTHHIIPIHMGGTDEEDNIIKLTLLEHAEAHLLLWALHKHVADLRAYNFLIGRYEKYGPQGTVGIPSGQDTTGFNNPMHGKEHSAETRKKISDNIKGENHPFYGKVRPNHSKRMYEDNPFKGKTHTEETKELIRNKVLNQPTLICSICGKEIKGKGNLSQHIRTHS